MGVAGRALVEAEFSWDRSADRMLAVVQELSSLTGDRVNERARLAGASIPKDRPRADRPAGGGHAGSGPSESTARFLDVTEPSGHRREAGDCPSNRKTALASA